MRHHHTIPVIGAPLRHLRSHASRHNGDLVVHGAYRYLSGPTVVRKRGCPLGDRPVIGLIIAKYGHFNHVGATGEVRAAPGAPLAVHGSVAEWVRTGSWISEPA